MTSPTPPVQSLDDLMRLAGRLESLPLTFDVVMVRKQRAELRAAIESFVASAIASKEAEVVRLREAGAQLANCAFNLSQAAGRVLSERDAKTLKLAQTQWDAALNQNQGEPK